MGTLVIIVVVVAGYLYYKRLQRQRRHDYLMSKYGDEGVVGLLMDGRIWQGQTAEMLRDAAGAPAAIDRSVMKTRTRDVWKYRPNGRNRYGLRVTLEDGEVVGWEQKGG